MANYKTFKELVGQQQLLKNIPLGSARDDGREDTATRQGIGARPNLQNTLEIREEPNLFERTLQYMQRASDDFNAVRNAVLGDPEQEDTRRFELPPQTMELRPLEEVLRQPTQTELAFSEAARVPRSVMEAPVSSTPLSFNRQSQPEDMDVDAKAARTRRSLEEQAQPDRGVFAYEGPEAAMSEVSIETNLSTEQKRNAQSSLNELGFNVGSADGIIGNRTRAGIAEYQVTVGLPPTGFLDERTQDALSTGTQGRPLSEVEAEFDFIGGTKGGRALRAAEELRYNAYSLNNQPVLSGNRKHNSGLTLGVGVDLGQQSAEELRELGVPNRIVEKLEQSGFLGVTPENIVAENDAFRRQGHAAMYQRYQEQMQNGTLVTLTPEEMDTLTQVLYEEKYMPTVEEIYNSTSYSEEVPFDELSEEARAALGAEAWHYTNNLRNNASAFARAASRNDVSGITELYLYPERGPKVLNALGIN